MKNIFRYAFLLAALLMMAGCDIQDNEPIDTTDPNTIQGTWHLTKVQGGLQGENLVYGRGEVVWTFSDNHKLLIENNIMTQGPEQIHSGFPSGIYEYTIQLQGNTQFLSIETMTVELLITDGKLYLDDGLTDGFLRTMER